jgi:Mg2+/citrate symporter
MVRWGKLLHPWWRPVGIVAAILGVAAATASLIFDLSPVLYLPFSIIVLVALGLGFREMLRVQAAAENKERYRPSSDEQDDAASGSA